MQQVRQLVVISDVNQWESQSTPQFVVCRVRMLVFWCFGDFVLVKIEMETDGETERLRD